MFDVLLDLPSVRPETSFDRVRRAWLAPFRIGQDKPLLKLLLNGLTVNCPVLAMFSCDRFEILSATSSMLLALLVTLVAALRPK